MAEENVTNNETVEVPQSTEQTKPTFDEMLSDKAYQSEFDKRIAKALEKQRGKLEAEFEEKFTKAKTEAEKLAQMDAQQKAQYEAEQREKLLAERESELNKRELQSVAKEQLLEKGLSPKLSNLLDYSSAEACSKSIEALASGIQEMVEATVNEKLRGSSAPKKAPERRQGLTKEDLKRMNRDEIQAIPFDVLQEILKQG